MKLSKLLKQAEKQVSYGKTNEAIDTYQEILSEDFQNTEVHGLIADLYIEKRDMQRASRHLFKVAADHATHGNLGEAAAAYRKIIKILPKNILAREKLLEIFTRNNAKSDVIHQTMELCSIFESEGNVQKTIEYLEKLVAVDSGNRTHAAKLALFLNERGLKERAIEAFYQLAHEHLSDEQPEEALRSLEKVRLIDPKEKNLATRFGEVYERQGKIEKAIEVLLTSLAENPVQPEIMLYLAKLCIKAGKVDEAERVYEKLIRFDKSYLAQTVPFIEVLVAERKIDRALAHIERLYKESSEAPVRRRCVETLEEILKLDPQKLDAYRLLEAFYSSTFEYGQLAITLHSHADAYVAKCEYAKALDLARQLVELEPYNEDHRKKLKQIEKLVSDTSRAKPAQKADRNNPKDTDEEDEESSGLQSNVDAHFDSSISIVTEEDVESFIVDVELLEKFGQHASAIGRLEHILKQYPQEVRFRQKLKSLYFERKMPKKAAQECLEIAKLFQLQGQKEEASKYLREAQRLNPALSSAKRETVSTAASPSRQPAVPDTQAGYGALRGDLSEIGLLDVVQILENCQKNGKLVVNSEKQMGTIFFNGGRIVNAKFADKVGEQAVFLLVAVKGGTFDFQPATAPFAVVIHNSNTNLLLEALRLLDEANRDLGEQDPPVEDSERQSPAAGTAGTRGAAPVPAMPPVPAQRFVEDNPLEEL